MALNLSRQMYSNRFVGDGSPDRGADGCAKPWKCIRGVEDIFDYHEDRGGSSEGVNDILDVLPTDPFGMDISTTFTAITGWLGDYGAYGSHEAGSSKRDYDLYAGFNFLWNSALRFHSLPVNFEVGFDEAYFTSASFNEDGVTQQSSSYSCCNAATDSNVDDIIHKLPSDSIFHEAQEDQSVSGACIDDAGESPHQALYFAFSYLASADLLASERVCRSFRSTIKTDPFLWRNIHIDRPLHENLTDEVLIQLTSRAQRQLQSLSLVECSRITDDGLKLVLESNPQLTKLNIPGCTRLSIDAIIDNLKVFSSAGTRGIKYLRIAGVYGVTREHLDDLNKVLGTDKDSQHNAEKPHFFGRDTYYLPIDDERTIDVEPCPRCENVKLVYDCPIEGCPSSKTQTCRACINCIQRCIQCGQCITNRVFIENFCLEYLCADCSNQLPNHHGSAGNSDAHIETGCNLSVVG